MTIVDGSVGALSLRPALSGGQRLVIASVVILALGWFAVSWHVQRSIQQYYFEGRNANPPAVVTDMDR